MNAGFYLKNENPKDTSGLISKLFFGWIAKSCYDTVKKKITITDLYQISKSNKAHKLANTLEEKWNQEKEKPNPSLIKAIAKTVWSDFMVTGLLLFTGHVLVRSLQALMLAYFINLVTKTGEYSNNKLFMWVIFLVFLTFLNVTLHLHCEYLNTIIGMRIRIATTTLVYRKLLKLNTTNLVESEQLIDFISNDLSRFDLAFVRLHILWIMPLQISFTIYLTWDQVGISALAGVLPALLLLMPIQTILDRIISKMRYHVSHFTNLRVKLINEVISGIKALKIFAWEKYFAKVINLSRQREIKALTKLWYLRGFVAGSRLWTEHLISFLTIVVYVYLNDTISADQLFFVVLSYEFLSSSVSIWYPTAVNYLTETLVSIERVKHFLLLREKSVSDSYKIKPTKDILLNDVTASWDLDKTVLKNINFYIPQGCLCAIVGSKGAGKTSILKLVLGELSLQSGSIEIGDFISYASQNPWIFASTIRNNIIFGHIFDQIKFDQVVKACRLTKDFQKFPEGDQTIVGESGVILNTRQRAKINLARAVYRNADIYLLDEPFSALGAHTGKKIFQECLIKFLKNKTKVIVSRQLQYVKKADHVIVVDKGKIRTQGNFEEVRDSLDMLDNSSDCEEDDYNSNMTDKSGQYRNSSVLTLTQTKDDLNMCNYFPFKAYIKASNNFCGIICFFVILILSQVIFSAASFWPTIWSRRADEKIRLLFSDQNHITHINRTVMPTDNREKDNWMFIYMGFTLLTVFLILLRSIIFFKLAMRASLNIHDDIFTGLLETPINFFTVNPRGKIQSRLSNDIKTVDDLLPNSLFNSLQLILECLGNIIMIIISSYYMTSFMAMLLIILTIVSCWYIYVVTKLNYLEEEAHAPVFSYLRWSLSGILTIRALKRETLLNEEFENHQDTHTSSWLLLLETNLFFSMVIKLLGVCLVSIVSFTCVLLKFYMNFDSSDIGLSISQAMILLDTLESGASHVGQVISHLTSVDRVLQYTKLEKENEFTFEDGVFRNASWPSGGLIEYKNVTLVYPNSEQEVLKKLNFVIRAGTKVGVIGKPGAGKSSLISALLRLVNFQGSIFIDNINSNTVNIEKLRKSISVIPQEPILFTSTLRYNLDPNQEFDDGKLWKALEEVELKDVFKSLDIVLCADDKYLSTGQKQLLSIARAVLRNNKILVLDETTANVDLYTESLIDKIIRRHFCNSTVITITQNLNGIMDCDMILVLESGSIVEYDHPHMLLQNSDGHLSKMVAETGVKTSTKFHRISRESFNKNII